MAVAPDQATQADCLVAVTHGDWSVDCSDQLKSQAVAFANLNTPPPSPSSKGKFTIALDIDRGANPSDEINVDLNGRWLRPGYRHNVDVTIDYQETNNVVTDDDADANYQYGQTEPGANVRWTAAWQTPWRGITASHSGEVGWVFSISDAYLFQSKTSLTFPLYQGLIAELRLEYDKFGVNVSDSGDHDLEWILALGYKW